MNNEENIIALLTEIRDLLKARPVASSGSSKSGPTSSRLAGLAWAEMEWPQFTNKSGKRKARTLGESTQSGYGQSDIAWWAANYQPKEYKGQIPERDIAFKAALVEADAFCEAHPLVDNKQSSNPPPQRSGPKPGPDGSVDTSDASSDVPF